LDDLGLFRVFLGVENASEHGLRNLNRKCTYEQIIGALQILNDFDVHIAFNILMFEPDTVFEDILINLRFIERHVENPFNFCRAEAYAGTGLEKKLRAEDRLLGDFFGFDYRLKDQRSEAFHQIANYAFFERNFSDLGLHYFNMQVDFYFQLLRRFHPDVLSQTLRGEVRNFIKQTNIDTYHWLCEVYDLVAAIDPRDQVLIRAFAKEMRMCVDASSRKLRAQGEHVQRQLGEAFQRRGQSARAAQPMYSQVGLSLLSGKSVPYTGLNSVKALGFTPPETGWVGGTDIMDVAPAAIPYHEFREQLLQQKEENH
jgi:hypothetical protein